MAKKMATKTAKKAPKKAAKQPAPKAPGATDAIQQLDAEFMKAANAKKAGALVKAFYAPDAVLMPPNRPIVEGRAGIQSFLQSLIDSGLSGIKLESWCTAVSRTGHGGRWPTSSTVTRRRSKPPRGPGARRPGTRLPFSPSPASCCG